VTCLLFATGLSHRGLNGDGMLIGNAVEVSMVKTCGWDLGDPYIKSQAGKDS